VSVSRWLWLVVVAPGIPVGTVVGTLSQTGVSQQSISVAPLANLSNLSYVDVVLWEPGA
jgi:cell shape-determining protein MreC